MADVIYGLHAFPDGALDGQLIAVIVSLALMVMVAAALCGIKEWEELPSRRSLTQPGNRYA